MKIFKDIAAYKKWKNSRKISRQSLGFVPTMGALHEGHLELVKRAQKKCELCVVSIFVNPTQFNNPDDLKKYPRTLEADLRLLKKAQVDAVFLPTEKMLYPDDFRFKVSEELESHLLCGEHRPGHFSGVLTVVLKLLNIVRPHSAFFGEKDFQQLKLIEDMAQSFFLDCKIVAVPTQREKTGLALSSRNQRLNEEALLKAQLISKLLMDPTQNSERMKAKLIQEGFQVDYVQDLWKRRFVAAHLEGVRLIDNAPLKKAPKNKTQEAKR